MLIDSHAHIQGKEYAGEAEAVIERARGAGVEIIVAVGGAGDMSSNSEAVRLANSFANVYATVGMHPHDAKDVGADELAVLKDLAGDAKVVAIGETGLDYYYSHSPHDVQRRGVDGVVCGHIHRAEIRQLDGVLYCNDGDWVESCSALIEDRSGSLSVWNWTEMQAGLRVIDPVVPVQDAA